MHRLISLICFVFLLSGTTSWANINFQTYSLEEALKKGADDKKLIFVDTYATWCAPCKVMDKVFEENSVSKYFNDNFVNVKINMDGPQGASMLQNYEVVWLPTLLILNSEGDVLSKIDRIVSGDELISIAQEVLSGNFAAQPSSLIHNPFIEQNNNTEEAPPPPAQEEILYVFDERASSARPHIMYHEAYLHLQLMDGKHQKVVRKYLSTQNDWGTEKNLKFIFDFLQDVDQGTFEYFINNKSKFEAVIGKDKVNRSLNILVNQKLLQTFPRPGLNETTQLLSLLGGPNPEAEAHQMLLDRFKKENKDFQFITLAKDYLQKLNPNDHTVLFDMVSMKMNRSDHHLTIKEDIQNFQAIEQKISTNCDYALLLSKLLLKNKQREEALKVLNRLNSSHCTSEQLAELQRLQQNQ